MSSGPLCALLWRILTWCTRKQVTLKARHIPGRLNMIADKLSRLGWTIQTEWSLLPEVFEAICNRWHWPQIDLFATSLNSKLSQFVSPMPDPLAIAVDVLSLPWEDLDAYAFPPIAILDKVSLPLPLSLPWEDLDAYAFPPIAILGKVSLPLEITLHLHTILLEGCGLG